MIYRSRAFQLIAHALVGMWILGIFGCASVPLAPPAQAQIVRNMQPPPGKALVYVIRMQQLQGSGLPTPIYIDQRHIGTIVAGTYLATLIQPGRHSFSVQFGGDRKNKFQIMDLSLAEGQTAFLLYKRGTMNLTGTLQILPESTGRAYLSQYRLSAKTALTVTTPSVSSTASRPRPQASAPAIPKAAQPPLQKPQVEAKPILPDKSFAKEQKPYNTTTKDHIESIPPDLQDLNFGRYYALVIGNNRYQLLPTLRTAEADAKTVAQMLRSLYGFHTSLLLNATRSDIVISLDQLRQELNSNDNLLIYYAGHGYYDEDIDRGYWLPIDAEQTTSANWVSNADITDKLKAMTAKHVLVVADSCYSGTLTRGVAIKLKTPNYLKRLSKKRARTVLTSGGLEPVLDAGAGAHSVFANAFINALKENTGIMDGTELFTKVRRPVALNAPQTPQYSDIRFAGHEGGDFLFIRKK